MTLDDLLGRLVAVGIVIGGIGYAVGQFLAQRAKGHSDALNVALKEIEALRVRAERQDAEMRQMHLEMAALRAENESFRSLLTGGTFLAEQIRTLIADEVEKGTHAVVAAIKSGS